MRWNTAKDEADLTKFIKEKGYGDVYRVLKVQIRFIHIT